MARRRKNTPYTTAPASAKPVPVSAFAVWLVNMFTSTAVDAAGIDTNEGWA